jgi:tetratricopeptide (TPR) repeat protein
MLRTILILLTGVLSFFSLATVEAGHGHHHHCHSGFGHYHYRGHGFNVGTYGFGGLGISYSAYSPFRNYAYYGGWNNCYRPNAVYYYRPACVSYTYFPRNYSCYRPTFNYAPICNYPTYYAQPYHFYYGASYSNPYGYNDYTPVYSSSYAATEPAETLSLVAKLIAITKPKAGESPRAFEPRYIAAKPSVDSAAEARRWMALGDAAFREGRFLDALTRYRTAADAAPSLAETHYRKGHAYLANGQYRLATTAFQQGAKLDRSGHREGFNLNQIYTSEEVKTTHLENLAALATMNSKDADAYYLLGVMLKYNGESERAEKFFSQAWKVGLDAEGIPPVHLAEAPVRTKEI